MLQKISKREKYALLAVCVIVLVVVFDRFLLAPLLSKRNRIEHAIKVQEKALIEIKRLKAEYEAIKNRADLSKQKIAKRDKNFTLFSFLDNLSGSAGIKNNIAYMKPSSSILKDSPYTVSQVEMKLQDITMEQLTMFLHMIETSDNIVYIRRLSLSKTDDRESFLSVVFQAETMVGL